MASPTDLSLECNSSTTQVIEHFLVCLEQERLKIDAFKRELPLCTQLINNALESSRKQLQGYRGNKEQSKQFEDFLMMNHNSAEKTVNTNSVSGDKANWMSSAQLCSQASDRLSPDSPKNFTTEPKIGGAFLPFSNERNQIIPDLALSAFAHREVSPQTTLEMNNGGRSDSSLEIDATANNSSNIQRKARRCWSPDLHRRFVNALQMLGGSQVATPKQIRELMEVDGLTNDEVKSHLQKYRLHTRRPSLGPQPAGAAVPQLIVFRGVWVPPEYAPVHGGAAIYASHAPTQYCATPSGEFYPVSRSNGSFQESESTGGGKSDSGGEDRRKKGFDEAKLSERD